MSSYRQESVVRIANNAGDPSDGLEYRTFECRAVSDDPSERIISGKAILFERWNKVADKGTRWDSSSYWRREKFTHESVRVPDLSEIVNEAADRALRKVHRDIQARVNHDQQKYLGSMFNRSLKLTKTDESLDFELRVPNTSVGNDLLGVMQNEGGTIKTSIGFHGRGKNSNIKRIDVDDATMEAVLSGESRANVSVATPLDNTEINLQEGKLDGSDYVESLGRVQGGRSWRVYKSLDLREITFLIGFEPAHEGVGGKIGGLPTSVSQRSREIEILRLATCSVG